MEFASLSRAEREKRCREIMAENDAVILKNEERLKAGLPLVTAEVILETEAKEHE